MGDPAPEADRPACLSSLDPLELGKLPHPLEPLCPRLDKMENNSDYLWLWGVKEDLHATCSALSWHLARVQPLLLVLLTGITIVH